VRCVKECFLRRGGLGGEKKRLVRGFLYRVTSRVLAEKLNIREKTEEMSKNRPIVRRNPKRRRLSLLLFIRGEEVILGGSDG